MSREVSPNSHANINPSDFDMAQVIQELLPRGHVIHGYSSAGSNRMLMVLESRAYSDDEPLLGFGVDGRAERALGRALLTYAMRERDGLSHITENHYPESSEAQVAGGTHLSRFDNIVWGGDFKLYQDGDVVVASSNYGNPEGWGLSPLEVAAPDALLAITALADNYHFSGMARDRMSRLPAVSFE